jgi:hypothetical protein
MSYKENIFRCVIFGLGGGAAFAIWVLVLYALRGPQPFDEIGIGLGQALTFYLAGGAAGGLILGLLWPIAKWRIGAYVVSVFVCTVLVFCMGVQVSGNPVTWDYSAWLAVPVLAIIFGLAFGRSIWKAASRQ